MPLNTFRHASYGLVALYLRRSSVKQVRLIAPINFGIERVTRDPFSSAEVDETTITDTSPRREEVRASASSLTDKNAIKLYLRGGNEL